ncbi:MAG: GEVED domain-containing protein [Saprospiraceae bacterium]
MKLNVTLAFLLFSLIFQQTLSAQCNGQTYCTVAGDSGLEWMESFEMGAINNVTGDDGGYADYTNLTTDITLGQTVPFTCAPGYPGGSFTEVFQIWIDFNNDGDFEDAGEEVYLSGGTTTPVSGTFLVPINATPGPTTMRVMMSYLNASGPCEPMQFDDGETEDYCVNILEGNGCYQTPLTISDITDSDALASWLMVDDAESYTIRFREVGTTDWMELTTTDISITLPLEGCTIYEAQIETVCGGGLSSDFSFSTEFLTFGCGNCLDFNYCTIDNANTFNAHIENVTLNTMNSTTGDDEGYGDYTGPTVTSIEQGLFYDITTTVINLGYNDDQWYAAYIDFNADGDFDDPFELIMNSGDNLEDLSYTQTFTVPPTAVVGSSRLRVMVQNNNFNDLPTDPCVQFLNGEVEDYCIEITEGTGCYLPLETAIVDNQGSTVTVGWETGLDAESFTIRYRLAGSTTWTEVPGFTGNSAELTGLEECAIYEFQIQTICEGGDMTIWSNTISFLTFGCGNCLDLTYCEIEDANTFNAHIENITLNTMNSTTGDDNGYGDYTGPIVTSLEQGLFYDITTTVINTGYNNTQWYAAYIDFNADGDFDDPFEMIMNSGENLTDLSYTQNFPVPPTAVVGSSRMRVIVQNNNFNDQPTDPCIAFLNGEAEDYCIEITEGTGCYLPLETAVIDNIGESIVIGWEEGLSAESFTIRYREIGTTTWTELTGITGNTYELLGLEECNEYEFQIRTICGNDMSGWSSSYMVRTFGCGACFDFAYCETTANNSNDDFIGSVVFGDLDNVSGNNGGYIDFADDFGLVVRPDSSYNMVLTPEWPGFMFNVGWRVWIDFNQDGVFDNDTEIIFEAAASTDIQMTTVTIPSDVEFGLTKMRISMKEGILAESCETFGFGEVEDYCVTVLPTVLPCLQPLNVDTTNVQAGSVNFIWEADQYENAIGYIVRFKEVDTDDWMEFSTNQPAFYASGLTICTDYEYQVRSVCPQDFSDNTESFFFKTACVSSTEDLYSSDNITTLNVYPNPFTDRIQLDFELQKQSNVSVRLVNTNGQLIQIQELDNLGVGQHNIQFVQPELPAGMYMIQIATDEEVVIRKVVKQG